VKTTFSVNAQGRRNKEGTTLNWQLFLNVRRLGNR
jgi:hypothetical protein